MDRVMAIFTNDDTRTLDRLGLVFPENYVKSPGTDYREGNVNGIHVEVRLKADHTYNVLLSYKGDWTMEEAKSLQLAFNSAVESLENRALKQLDLAHAFKVSYGMLLGVEIGKVGVGDEVK